MSGLSFVEAHLLSLLVLAYKRMKLGLFGGRFSYVQKRKPFGWRHPKKNLSLGKSVLGLEKEEEEKGDLKRRNGFHLHSSPFFFLAFIHFSMVVYLLLVS